MSKIPDKILAPRNEKLSRRTMGRCQSVLLKTQSLFAKKAKATEINQAILFPIGMEKEAKYIKRMYNNQFVKVVAVPTMT
ncbi:MAG: hypothetical protein FWG77_05940 [Treponema sp.]|nr:hypothetical protein [Treponema sp.]